MKAILITPTEKNTERDYELLKEYLKNYRWQTEEIEEEDK